VRFAAIVLIAAAAVAATAGGSARGSRACHASYQSVKRVNLDGDAAKETVSAFELTSCDHTQQSAGIRIADHCGSHWNEFLVSGPLRHLGPVVVESAAQVVEADGTTRRREVFFAVHGSDDAGPRGIAKVVRLDRLANGCAGPRILFAYATRGVQDGVVGWTVRLREASTAFRGKEVIVTETLAGEGPRTKAFSGYRYDRARRRYVLYVQS
jgi:hypothetical protein